MGSECNRLHACSLWKVWTMWVFISQFMTNIIQVKTLHFSSDECLYTRESASYTWQESIKPKKLSACFGICKWIFFLFSLINLSQTKNKVFTERTRRYKWRKSVTLIRFPPQNRTNGEQAGSSYCLVDVNETHSKQQCYTAYGYLFWAHPIYFKKFLLPLFDFTKVLMISNEMKRLQSKGQIWWKNTQKCTKRDCHWEKNNTGWPNNTQLG